MQAQLIRLLDALKGSYWFLPTVMTLLSALLAWCMVTVDSGMGPEWTKEAAWIEAAHPEGARQLLSVIGGSMITVAGTVFSVTIAAVVYASGQYGPRLLSNFMSDRGNQVTLGTFISTFAYCLLVLRTIRSADESGGGEFVPDLAILVALILALCSIAVLIYFIHHVPSKLHISSVIEGIGSRLIRDIATRFPDKLGQGADGETTSTPRSDGGNAGIERREEVGKPAGCKVNACATGYLQLIDDEALFKITREHDLQLHIRVQPGDFIHAGQLLAHVSPLKRCSEAVCQSVQDTFSVGVKRTPLQDIRFSIDEIVEIAMRALSPGVNDPFTAITCIDWLSAAITDVSQREQPSRERKDESGNVRVIAYPVNFETLVERSFGALSQYCAGDAIVAVRYIDVLQDILAGCQDASHLACIQRQLNVFVGLAATKLAAGNLDKVIARVHAQPEQA